MDVCIRKRLRSLKVKEQQKKEKLSKKSKYYYDYTRNMSEDKQQVNCNCDRNLVACNCMYSQAVQEGLKKKKDEAFFEAWCKSLEEQEQPTCNIDNPEDCDSCGS